MDSLALSFFKNVSIISEHVTCIECCRHYVNPETATCGHTLCSYCWYCRPHCVYCNTRVCRKTLTRNIEIHNFTRHVKILVTKFEDLFDVKLSEFEILYLDVNNKSNRKTKDDFINKQDNDNNKHDLQKLETNLQENDDNTQISAIESDTIINLQTPPTINEFVDCIIHESTPVEGKIPYFANDTTGCSQEPGETLLNEIMSIPIEQTLQSEIKNPMAIKNMEAIKNKKVYVGYSRLTASQILDIKHLCKKRDGIWEESSSKDLSHLIIHVNHKNRAPRTLKYMHALAAGKWIVSFAWAQKCLQTDKLIDEEPYEVLDHIGVPAPRLSRIAEKKLFDGITFYCMSPLTTVSADDLQEIIEAAGGRVVENISAARALSAALSFLLAEPINTQETDFSDLAVKFDIVPLHSDWVMHCLANYGLKAINSLLLCPVSVLPAATATWPASLITK